MTIQTLTLFAALFTFIFFIRIRQEDIFLLFMLSFSVASVMFGKLFCGYFCPFHAFDKSWGYILDKYNIKKINSPRILKKKLLYYSISLILLALVMLRVLSTLFPIKIQIPFLILAFPILAIFTSDLWHNYMCPFGFIMNLPSFRRILMPNINNLKCKYCNICVNICPTKAIDLNNNELMINETDCILCYQCEKVCNFDSIEIKTKGD